MFLPPLLPLFSENSAPADQPVAELSPGKIATAEHATPACWLRPAPAAVYPPQDLIGATEHYVVWTRNKARLFRYIPPGFSPFPLSNEGTRQPPRSPVLLIYALINRPSLYDLCPGDSLVEYLLAQGFDIYLLDWGQPGPEDAQLDFAGLVLDYLSRAVQRVLHLTGASKLALVAYCLGGVLALLYAALHPQAPVSRLVLLATPVRFARSPHRSWVDPSFLDITRLVESFAALGVVPALLVNGGAHLIRPESDLAPYLWYVRHQHDATYLQGWMAMQQWLATWVDFPLEAFRQWISDFYQQDLLAKGALLLRGQPVKLASISLPLLALNAASDELVPVQMTSPLLEMVNSADRAEILAPCGHVGLVAGRAAVARLWPCLADFLQGKSAQSAAARFQTNPGAALSSISSAAQGAYEAAPHLLRGVGTHAWA